MLPSEIAVFDCETDGVDTETCRIVSCFVGLMDTATGQWTEKRSWLLNQAITIPDGAIAVHGITNEKMRAEGTDAAEGLFEINQLLNIYNRKGIAIAGMNLRYDFTLLDREMRRWYPGIRPLDPKPVLDAYVLDKWIDKYRKGKRNLTTMAPVYGVKVEANAHDAEADCLMAGRVVVKQLQHEWLKDYTLEALHDKQVQKAAEQADGLRDYFQKSGKLTEAASVQNEWPVVEFDEGF